MQPPSGDDWIALQNLLARLVILGIITEEERQGVLSQGARELQAQSSNIADASAIDAAKDLIAASKEDRNPPCCAQMPARPH